MLSWMLDHLFAYPLRVFDQVHYRHVFISGGNLLGLVAPRLRQRPFDIHRRGVHLRVGLQIELLYRGACRRSEVLVFGAKRQSATRREDAFLFLRLGGRRPDQLQFFFERNLEGVALMRCLPTHPIGWHGSQFERPQAERRIGARHGHGFPRHTRYFCRRDHRRRRKAPGSIDDHAHTEAERAAIGYHRHFERLAGSALRVQPHCKELLAVADNAYVGV